LSLANVSFNQGLAKYDFHQGLAKYEFGQILSFAKYEVCLYLPKFWVLPRFCQGFIKFEFRKMFNQHMNLAKVLANMNLINI
jgi:hypothetical protein